MPTNLLKRYVARCVVALVVLVGFARAAPAQKAQPSQTLPGMSEIPLEHCDKLPVVKVHVGEHAYQFLVDTAATSMLNLKSFSGGTSKEVNIASWTGTAATSAREVTLSELTLGTHALKQLRLPAIDLSPIGNACGGTIDGILGVDLLDRMGVTIDMKRQVASLGDPPDPLAAFAEMEAAMVDCHMYFERGKAAEFEQCLDPEIVLYTRAGEFKGRAQVMKYMNETYFKYAPDVHYDFTPHDVQLFGNALWYSYDYALDTPEEKVKGHGMSMCRKTDGRWRILNMHHAETSHTTAQEIAEP